MALDPAVSDALTQLILMGHKEQAARIGVIADNLTQGLGVVNTTLIQQHGSTADDAATMAALRTAIYVPEKQGT